MVDVRKVTNFTGVLESVLGPVLGAGSRTFVKTGLSVSYSSSTATVTAGTAYITTGGEVYEVELEATTSTPAPSLPTTVYLVVNPTGAMGEGVVTARDTPPSGVHVALASIAADGSVTDERPLPMVDTARMNNVHWVRSTDDLLRLFPNEDTGSWSEESPLEDGDVVRFDSRNAPYRPNRDLRIESVQGLTIMGSRRSSIDVKPEDGANAGKFVFTGNDANPSDVTFRDLGYHGNQQEMTGGETPFILNWTCANLKLDNCHAEHTYPYHVHNGGGTAVRIKQGGTGFRAFGCTFDEVGDRAIQCVNTEDVIIDGCRAINGYDRMIHLSGARHVTVSNNHNVDSVEGSAFGVNDGTQAAYDLVFTGNHSRGAMRNLFSFEAINGNGINRVWCVGNTKDPDTLAGGTAHYRNLVHQEGTTGAYHFYLANGSTADAEGAFEVLFDHTVADYNFALDCEWLVDHQGGDDCKFGKHNVVASARTAPYRAQGGARARYGSWASTENASNTPGGGLFEPGEWSRHRNSSTAGVKHVVRLPPHATGTWYEPATDTVDP